MTSVSTSVNEVQVLTELDKLYSTSANKQISLLMHFHDGDQEKVVQSMFDTLVEGQFNANTNCTIRSEAHINVLFFGLLPRLSPHMQSSLVDTFATIVERHFRNAESCRNVNLTRHLVTLLASSKLLEVQTQVNSSSAHGIADELGKKSSVNEPVNVDVSRAMRAVSTSMTPVLERSMIRLLHAIGAHHTSIADIYDLFRPIVALGRPSLQRLAPSTNPLTTKKNEACALLMIHAMEAMASGFVQQGRYEPSFFDLDPSVTLHPEDVNQHELLLDRPGIGTRHYHQPLSSQSPRESLPKAQQSVSSYGATWLRPQRVSGIVIPPTSLEKWPLGGYTLVLSIRSEVLDSNIDAELFTFRGSQGHGISAHIVSSNLVFCVCSNGATNSHSEGANSSVDRDQSVKRRNSQTEGKQVVIEGAFANRKKGANSVSAGFTTVYISHMYKLWRSRLTVGIDGKIIFSKRVTYPPAAQMTPLADGYLGGPRGQLGRILLLSTALEKKDVEAMHTLISNSNFNLSSPAKVDPLPGPTLQHRQNQEFPDIEDFANTGAATNTQGSNVLLEKWNKGLKLWKSLYGSKIMFAFDSRNVKILNQTPHDYDQTRKKVDGSQYVQSLKSQSIPFCVVRDAGPDENDAYVLSAYRGTVPISRNTTGSIGSAFACAGGSFRMLLPVLLMSVRDGDLSSFQQLSKLAEIIVPKFGPNTIGKTPFSTDLGPKILSSTVSLLASLVSADTKNLGLFLDDSGPECLNWIFLRVPKEFITIHLWKACRKLCRAILSSLAAENNSHKGVLGSVLPEFSPVFRSALNLILFDLKIWAHGSFEVHGNVLSEMHEIILTDLHIASSLDVQDFVDALDIIYNSRSTAAHRDKLLYISASHNEQCALRNAAVGVLEALIFRQMSIAKKFSSEVGYNMLTKLPVLKPHLELNNDDDKKLYVYSCVVRFVTCASANVGRELSSKTSNVLNNVSWDNTSFRLGENSTRRHTEPIIQMDQEEFERSRLSVGLILECSRIIVKLLVQALVEPDNLCLLYHANLHGCMWQLLLTDTDSLRQMGITIMQMTLSVGKVHRDYLLEHVSIAKQARKSNRQASVDLAYHSILFADSPWDDSSVDDTKIRSHTTHFERMFYRGLITGEFAAQIYHCLQHAPFSMCLIESLLQALVDDKVEDSICGDTLARYLENKSDESYRVYFVEGRLPLFGVILDLTCSAPAYLRFKTIRMVSSIIACSGRNKRKDVRRDAKLLHKLAKLSVCSARDESLKSEDSKFGDFFGCHDESQNDTITISKSSQPADMSNERLRELWTTLTSPSKSGDPGSAPNKDFGSHTSRLSIVKLLVEKNTKQAADMLIQYLWSSHEVNSSEDAKVYHEIVKGIESSYPDKICYLAEIAAVELIVDIVETSAEALQIIDASLKGLTVVSASDQKEKEDNDGQSKNSGNSAGRFLLVPVEVVTFRLYTIMARITARLGTVLENKKICLFRLGPSGALRWEGASDAGLLWNDIVLTAMYGTDVILGNSWHQREKSKKAASLHFEPFEDLMTAVLRLWNLLSPQVGSNFVSFSADKGMHGSDPLSSLAGVGNDTSGVLFSDTSEDVGVDVVPIRAYSSSDQDMHDDDDDDDFFLLDPTIMGGCIRPLYPSVTQLIINLALYMIHHFIGAGPDTDLETRYVLAQKLSIQMTSTLHLMGILSPSSSPTLDSPKTKAQQNMLLWLAPQLVKIYHFTLSATESTSMHAFQKNQGRTKHMNQSKKNSPAKFCIYISDLIDNVLQNIAPQLRHSPELAQSFSDVLFGGSKLRRDTKSQCAPWRDWEMHMAGSRLFLEQKLCFENRVEWYQRELKAFTLRLEARIKSKLDEDRKAHENAICNIDAQQWTEHTFMKSNASSRTSDIPLSPTSLVQKINQRPDNIPSKKLLLVQEIDRKEEAIVMNRYESVYTVQSIRKSLEELVYMHESTPWAGLVSPSLKKNLYFWSISKHETAQRMHHRLHRELKRRIHHEVISRYSRNEMNLVDFGTEESSQRETKVDQNIRPSNAVIGHGKISVDLQYWLFLGGRLCGSNTTTNNYSPPPSQDSSSQYFDEERENIESELAFSHRTVAAARALRESKGEEESGREFATVAQLVLPMCTVHGRLELTEVAIYFYADGIAGAGLDDHMAASNQIDANALLKERWVHDDESDSCHCCGKRIRPGFILSGKHHCRCCGNVVCSDCSSQKCVLPALGFSEAVRVCDICFAREAESKRSGGKGSVVRTSPKRSFESKTMSTNDSEHSNRKYSKDSEIDILESYSSHKIQQLRNLQTRQILLSEITEVYCRRHLLRKSALELMTLSPSRMGYLFNFPGGHSVVQDIFRRIMSKQPPRLFGGLASVYTKWSSVSRPEVLLKECGWTQRWQSRQISNFEYLMRLNSIAGRTYNDLTQYPVFPWILKDFRESTSNNEVASLDLNDPSIYRDLSKPIGALNPERLANLRERFECYEDPTGGGAPPFLYGTHYSNVGSVLYFLSRIEPFTSYMLDLQSGEFDQPERMFHSLYQTWEGCMTNNSDLKELIPELFYMPECLVNTNGLEMGTMQNGTRLGDVRLPAWAKGSAEEFVRIHREALESDYVSANLHHWIDLIFGYKQKGDAAVDADNVFYYLTYEDAIDIDQIEDPVMRKAVEVQIANFGQCPSQLFSTPHPQRDPPAQVLLHDMARAANVFLQESIGRTIGNGLEKLSIAVASHLSEGSVAHERFTQASNAIGGLLNKVGQVASHSLNMATNAITGDDFDSQTLDQPEDLATNLGNQTRRSRDGPDFQQDNLVSMADTAGALGSISSIIVPRFGRDYECLSSNRVEPSQDELNHSEASLYSQDSQGVICEILAIDEKGLCCPFEFRLHRVQNHVESLVDRLEMSLVSPYFFSEKFEGEDEIPSKGKKTPLVGVFRVLNECSEQYRQSLHATGWSQQNISAVLPPYPTRSLMLSSRMRKSGVIATSLASEAMTTKKMAKGFLITAGHWDWTFKASPLYPSSDTNAQGSAIPKAPNVLQSVAHHDDITSCISVSYSHSFSTKYEHKWNGKLEGDRALMAAESAIALVGSVDGTISVWPVCLPGVENNRGKSKAAKRGVRVKRLQKRWATRVGIDALEKMKKMKLLKGVLRDSRTQFAVADESGPIWWLHGHHSTVTALDADLDLGIVVSGSESGVCLVHDLHAGTFLVSLAINSVPQESELDKETASSNTSDSKIGWKSEVETVVPTAVRLVRVVPNTSRVIVVTNSFMHLFSSSTGALIIAVPMSADTAKLPHSVSISPDSRYMLVATREMVTVQYTHNLKIVKIICRYVPSEAMRKLRSVGAIHVQGESGAECFPDGSVCVDQQITAAHLSPNGDVAFVGTEEGKLLAFLVQLNWDRTIS